MLHLFGVSSGPLAPLQIRSTPLPPQSSPRGWEAEGDTAEHPGKGNPAGVAVERTLTGEPGACGSPGLRAATCWGLGLPDSCLRLFSPGALPSSGARKRLAAFSKLNSFPGHSGIFQRAVGNGQLLGRHPGWCELGRVILLAVGQCAYLRNGSDCSHLLGKLWGAEITFP